MRRHGSDATKRVDPLSVRGWGERMGVARQDGDWAVVEWAAGLGWAGLEGLPRMRLRSVRYGTVRYGTKLYSGYCRLLLGS